MFSSSESWELQQHPRLWHPRAGGGAVHSIKSRHMHHSNRRQAVRLTARHSRLRFRNVRIVYGNARHWVDGRFPWSALEHPHGIGITCLPARMDASAGKINVAQMIFVIEDSRRRV